MEIQKKQFTYKGKTIDELKTLDVREFAKLVGSRQKRTILRNFQEIEDFINRSKVKLDKSKSIKTHQRSLIVVPEMIGWKVFIYNGNKFVPVEIIMKCLDMLLENLHQQERKLNTANPESVQPREVNIRVKNKCLIQKNQQQLHNRKNLE